MTTGLDPTDKGFYHGGDIKGITGKLDYLKDLGVTSVWMTPSFKNKPVQGTGADASAGYHGYWITDFTQIDPHLGTNDDLKTLIAKAHAKGIKVFFDIITNHTADVIQSTEIRPTSPRRPRRTRTPTASRSTTATTSTATPSRRSIPPRRSPTPRPSAARRTRPSRCRRG